MTTPERSVEEIVDDLMESLLNNYVAFDTTDEMFKFKEELTQTLQAERQKREEVVREERRRLLKLIAENCNDQSTVYDVIEALTQPNNPK